jgi:hypothetical protein
VTKIIRNKTPCKHDWDKIENFLEKGYYQAVIDEIQVIDVLNDLWYLIEAYLALEKVEIAEELIQTWRYRISNPMSESYWLYYESLIKLKKNFLTQAKIDLQNAWEVSKLEQDIKIQAKIKNQLEKLDK